MVCVEGGSVSVSLSIEAGYGDSHHKESLVGRWRAVYFHWAV